MPKHLCARGRIALSGVDLRPQGPGGGSKRTSFRRLRALNSRRAKAKDQGKHKCQPMNGAHFVNLRSTGLDHCKISDLLVADLRVMTSSGHENLFRADLRPFRWHAVFRSRRRAAKIASSGAALAASAVIGGGRHGQNGRRALMRTRRRPALSGDTGAVVVCRSRELADPDIGTEHPDRSDLVGARVAGQLGRPEAP